MSASEDARNAQRVARLLHARSDIAPGAPIAPPIVMASSFHLPGNPADAAFQYGRFHNPSWDAVEHALAILEDAPVVGFPSGMAAIAAILYSQLRSGDRVLLPSDGYYTTRALAEKYLGGLGVSFDLRATADFLTGGFEGYRLVWIETPSNPGLDVCDIAAVAKAAHAAGARVAVDNTTMTPLGQRPLDLGADFVVAADTKAPAGHADVLFGHVAARDKALLDSVRDWRKFAGAIPGPFEAWLVHRGLETLELRFSRMCETAVEIARRLAVHQATVAVRHPGLGNDPSHAIARKQMAKFGSLVGVTFANEAVAEKFIACEFIRPSTSFGSVHTSAERRARWGDAVAPGYVRLSIGCEPLEALWAAMETALKG
ncbi:MAG: cystathionine gamma-lyase [Proteobacteria bacterium]|nr:cystathionine gamma-lyase [Pseudomonadota bacterium]